MRAIVFGILIALAGCAPASDQPVAQAAPVPDAAQRAPKDLLTQDGVNYECSVPADCMVKNVGNCCGYYPACVNKDSPTFPEKVKAQCAESGMSSICGFQEIAGCDCIEGRCTALPDTGNAPVEVRKD